MSQTLPKESIFSFISELHAMKSRDKSTIALYPPGAVWKISKQKGM
jgi:hypothetical protein